MSQKALPVLSTLALLVCYSFGFAADAPVSTGCDSTANMKGGKTFYVDPIRGRMENDGSVSHPWRSLAEVVNPSSHLISTRGYTDYAKGSKELNPINPDGPVKAGDTLVLMSGDHGDVDIRQSENKNFISVVAGENQIPTIRSLRVISSSHWLFRGLKFQGARPTPEPHGGLVDVMDSPFLGPGDNIVFVSNSFSTQDDATGWSAVDWVAKPFEYGFKTRTRCTSLSESHFFNVRNAGMISGDDTTVSDNLIEFFGNDGFDITASNLTIRHNTIRSGRHSPAEPMHADGIQGWSLNGAINQNVRIEANILIDTNQSDENYMQGISIFDGVWDGLDVTNNVVLTNAWHGIALYGVDNARVTNNSVIPSRKNKYMTWIAVRDSKERRPSKNVIVRNNIAGQIVAGGENVEVDHNIVLKDVSQPAHPQGAPAAAAVVSFTLNNVPLEPLFKTFDMSVPTYDLRLAAKSLAREAGSDIESPANDVDGRTRIPPTDIGAYAR